jgi:hypothetical protein
VLELRTGHVEHFCTRLGATNNDGNAFGHARADARGPSCGRNALRMPGYP